MEATKVWTKEEQFYHRELWIKALRSGQYEQDNGVLHSSRGGYCCLGVACEISDIDKWKIDRHGSSHVWQVYDGSFQRLPDSVMEWLGLHTNNGSIFEINKSLASLNDEGVDFGSIANVIEKYLQTNETDLNQDVLHELRRKNLSSGEEAQSDVHSPTL